MRVLRFSVLAGLSGALLACAPVYDPYDSYGGLYTGGLYSGGLYDDRGYREPYAYPYGVHPDGRVFRTRSEREAYLRALRTADRRADRLDRDERRLERLRRERLRDERERSREARERRRAEWEDRRPVFNDRSDRFDAERRRAILESRRAERIADRSSRQVAREQGRLDRLRLGESARERLDRMDRVADRQAARQRLIATRSNADSEVRRLLPNRRQGESIGQFRSRIEQARIDAATSGRRVESILRGELDSE